MSLDEKLSSLADRLAEETNPIKRMEFIDEMLRPPEPQLLDTCVLQNLDWVDRMIEGKAGAVVWNCIAITNLEQRYGAEMAADLIDLGTLYKEFENRSGYPWLICKATVEEAGLLQGPKGERLRDLLCFFADHQDDWDDTAYPHIAKGIPLSSKSVGVSPLILRALNVKSVEEVQAETGPLAFLPDRGDRMVVSYALFSNVPVVLTTDLATLWRHREPLSRLGLQVMRPSELLQLYEPYWKAIDAELFQRRATKC